MSIESWKKEFYPCKADSKKAQKDPVGHSLQKWIGLLPKNMQRHKVLHTAGSLYIIDKSDCFMAIIGDTCTLCMYFARCNSCSLYKTLHRKCYGVNSEYSKWICKNNPKPMIKALEKTKKKEIQHVH